MSDKLGYVDFEQLIRKARMERSAALGNAIVGAVTAVASVFRRGIAALSRAAGRPKARTGADDNGSLDVAAHR